MLFLLLTFFYCHTFGQIVTDASEKVSNLLIAHGKVNVTRVITTGLKDRDRDHDFRSPRMDPPGLG
jgi:hypothetical protein